MELRTSSFLGSRLKILCYAVYVPQQYSCYFPCDLKKAKMRTKIELNCIGKLNYVIGTFKSRMIILLKEFAYDTSL